jgi:PAS domain S-box-containing protein
MDEPYLQFSRHEFGHLLTHDSVLESWGRSMTKALPAMRMGEPFYSQWRIIRPRPDGPIPEPIHQLTSKVVVMVHHSRPELTFKGQFEQLEHTSKYIFLGSPWLNDAQQLSGLGLAVTDFSLYDSMIDMLHLLYNNGIANKELQEVVKKLNLQKAALTKSNEKLQVQEEKYRNIIANMNLGLLEVDTNDIIQYCNQSFADISGYSIEELTGRKAAPLFMSEESQQLINSKAQLRQKGLSDVFEVMARNKRGDLRWWLISGAPQINDRGETIGSIGIHLDITAQKKLEKDLEIALKTAREASEAKEAFLANMSHEIRTPLNGIIGMIRELNKEASLSETQKNYVNSVSKASQHLLSIINNILDLTKIEAGEFHLEHNHFSLPILLNDVIAILQTQADAKHIALKTSIDPDITEVLIGDTTRLRQILINLLGNAIKFTEKGYVEIIFGSKGANRYHQELLITIKDTGIGMEPTFLQNLFSKFQQEDKSISRKYGGTGLGLAITKELIELMNGKIEVSSTKGAGTTITIALTLAKGNPTKVELEQQYLFKENLRHKSLLLVEDNEMNRMVAINAFTPYQTRITEALNGAEALMLLEKQQFDLILMDLQMPVMDGLEATQIIRKNMKIDTPIIALTANAFKSEIDTCLQAGMNDYVIKPFEESVLIQVVNKVMANHRQTYPTSPESDLSTETNQTMQLYDLSKLNEMSRGNEEFVLKMLELFITTTTAALEEIKKARTDKDIVSLRKLAHKIKPSVETMGILAISQDIKILEKFGLEPNDYPDGPDPIAERIINVLQRVMHTIKTNELNT